LRVLVTGGAGFIGSHLVDLLIESHQEVRVIDNFSTGKPSNLERHLNSCKLEIEKGDLLRPDDISDALNDCEVVYHMAANPEVRDWLVTPKDLLEQNVEATFNLLEAIQRNGKVETLVFASTSTVYGEPSVLPTPEEYGPLKPISLYGASKLAAEALMCAYASMHGFGCAILRLANIVGPRSGHGVIHDFIEKLRKNPVELEVLGDGTQSKSYLHVRDCVEGMATAARKVGKKVELFNIGSEDKVDVLSIAKIVKEEMGLADARIKLTGGVDGGRGWVGDVKLMQLDTSRLRSLGWSPRLNSAKAVRETAKALINSTE